MAGIVGVQGGGGRRGWPLISRPYAPLAGWYERRPCGVAGRAPRQLPLAGGRAEEAQER
jgi:hypothetical protein